MCLSIKQKKTSTSTTMEWLLGVPGKKRFTRDTENVVPLARRHLIKEGNSSGPPYRID